VTRVLLKLLFLGLLVLGGAWGIFYYQSHAQVDAEKQKLVDDNNELKQIVARLTAEHRVARLLVTSQNHLPDGRATTTLLFVEDARDGSPLAAREFIINGTEAHLDAMVIKFEHENVEKDDPLRGHSIALFTKIFGNEQSPDQGLKIDAPDSIPAVYQGTDSRVSTFERNLWLNFWKLARDPVEAHKQGVRVANGDGKWWPCRPDEMYTLTIESDGGLNLKTEPVPVIYREAMRRKP
jgi:hypothetical protein